MAGDDDEKNTVALLALLMFAVGGFAVLIWQSIPTKSLADTPTGPRTIAKRAELAPKRRPQLICSRPHLHRWYTSPISMLFVVDGHEFGAGPKWNRFGVCMG